MILRVYLQPRRVGSYFPKPQPSSPALGFLFSVNSAIGVYPRPGRGDLCVSSALLRHLPLFALEGVCDGSSPLALTPPFPEGTPWMSDSFPLAFSGGPHAALRVLLRGLQEAV